MQVRVELIHAGTPVVIDVPTFTLGRVRACEVQVEHPLVSRRHCRFEVDNDGMSVIDLGSSNGTYVGDTRIERHRLKPGEGVRIGLGGPEFVVVRVTVDGREVIQADPEELRTTMLPGATTAAIGGPARVRVTESHPPQAAPAAATAAARPVAKPTAAGAVPPPPEPPEPPEPPAAPRLESMIVLEMRGKERTLHRSAALLGRDDECDLVFPDNVVSRRHCEVVVGRGGAVVRDLGSRGGTWVDGRRVRGESPIGIGGALQLGEGGPELHLVRAVAGGAELPGATPPRRDAGSPLIAEGNDASNDPDRHAGSRSAHPSAAAARRGCARGAVILLALVLGAAACAAAL